jgi:hypothetical protein
MDDQMTAQQQSTSILELLYLIRAKNKGELSFAEWLAYASSWAAGVIAEYETGQGDTAPSLLPMQSAQGGDGGECQSCR